MLRLKILNAIVTEFLNAMNAVASSLPVAVRLRGGCRLGTEPHQFRLSGWDDLQ